MGCTRVFEVHDRRKRADATLEASVAYILKGRDGKAVFA